MSCRDILLVEDNPDDQLLARVALNKSRIANRLVMVGDGAAAIDYLQARGEFAGRDSADVPAVILLDLNLPKVSGLDLLRTIRSDPRTALLPVIVLTTSHEDEDLRESYRLGCNSFVRKPVNFEQFVGAVNQLGLYWLVLNEPPPVPSAET